MMIGRVRKALFDFFKDIDGVTALHLCAFFNCISTCDTLCARRAFVNAKDNQLLTPLFYACKANCPVRDEILFDPTEQFGIFFCLDDRSNIDRSRC